MTTLSKKFAALAKKLLAEGLIDEMPAERRSRFGSNALKVGGKLFALDSGGDLVLKLPRARVDELVAAGAGKQFDPGHGRLMKEWIRFYEWPRNAAALAREARDHAAK